MDKHPRTKPTVLQRLEEMIGEISPLELIAPQEQRSPDDEPIGFATPYMQQVFTVHERFIQERDSAADEEAALMENFREAVETAAPMRVIHAKEQKIQSTQKRLLLAETMRHLVWAIFLAEAVQQSDSVDLLSEGIVVCSDWSYFAVDMNEFEESLSDSDADLTSQQPQVTVH